MRKIINFILLTRLIDNFLLISAIKKNQESNSVEDGLMRSTSYQNTTQSPPQSPSDISIKLLEIQRKIDELILAANEIGNEVRTIESNYNGRTSKSELSRQLKISNTTLDKLIARGVLEMGVHYTINDRGRYHFNLEASRQRLKETGDIV